MTEHAEVEYIAPRNAILLTNQEWVDEDVTRSTFNDLEPGDEATIVRADSFKDETRLALVSFGMSDHVADITGDGVTESIIEYRVERRDEKGGSWKEVPGLQTTYPHGEVGDPVQPFEETIGPSYGFRIVYDNRTEEFAQGQSVSARNIGAQMNLVVVRGDR